MSLLALFPTLLPLPIQTTPAGEAIAAPRYFSQEFTAVDCGDVDGDGDLDLLMARLLNLFGVPFPQGAASIYLNDGAGGFSPAPQLSPDGGFGSRPRFGDFDGDGSVDILRFAVTGDIGLPVISLQILVRGPGGKFILPSGYSYSVGLGGVLAAEVDSACAGDFDGDGVDELAVSYATTGGGIIPGAASRLEVFEIVAGQLVRITTSSVQDRLWELCPLDIDNDGVAEIANFFTKLSLYRLSAGVLAPVTGSAAPPPVSPTSRPSRIDWEGDGDVDLLLVDNNTWSLLRNDLSAPFGGWTQVALPSPAAVAGISGASFAGESAADLDGDGRLELLLRPASSSTVAADHALVEFDPATGSWQLIWRARYTASEFVVAQFSRQCTKQAPFGCLDLDGDGQVERAIGQFVFFEEPSGVARETTLLAAGASLPPGAGTDLLALSGGYAAARDLEGDGDLDLLFDPLQPAQLGLRFLENDASGEFRFGALQLEGLLPGFSFGTPLLAAEDFSGDGRLDLLVGVKNPANGAVLGATLLRGLPSGAYGNPQDSQLTASQVTRLAAARCLSLRHGDLDGDGRMDLVTPDLILRTRDNGSFEALVDQAGFRAQAAGDLDGDGNAEVLRYTGNQLLALDFLFAPQSQGGAFLGSAAQVVSAANSSYGVASSACAVDLDGDGRAEVVSVGEVAVSPALEPGHFPLAVHGLNPSGSGYTRLFLSYAPLSELRGADLEGDGVEEALGFDAKGTFVLSGSSLAALEVRRYLRGNNLPAPAPRAPLLADLDGDGDAEFLEPKALIDGSVFTGPGIGSRRQYGQGAPGLGGVAPLLGISGVLRPGAGGADLVLVRGIGGGAGVLGIGIAAVDLPLLPGVALYIDPLLFATPIALSGAAGEAGAGAYALELDITLPALVGVSLTAQALLFDPNGPAGLSTTNGLLVSFGS